MIDLFLYSKSKATKSTGKSKELLELTSNEGNSCTIAPILNLKNKGAPQKNCVDTHSSHESEFKDMIKSALRCVKLGADAKYESGLCRGAPTVVSNECTKKGINKHKDSSLSCAYCSTLRDFTGSSNLSSYLKRNAMHVKRILA